MSVPRCKRCVAKLMAEGVGADFFVDAGLTNGFGNGFVDGTGIEMVTPLNTASRVGRDAAGWKYILPLPLGGSVGVFSAQCMGHVDVAVALFTILLMEQSNPS